MLKDLESKRAVRAYEEQKAKGSHKYGGSLGSSSIMGTSAGVADDSGHQGDSELDELWLSIRNFFDDLTSKGDKREFARNDKPNKLKFMEAC